MQTLYYVNGQRVSSLPASSSRYSSLVSSGYRGSGASNLYKQRYGEAASLLDQLTDQQKADLIARYGAQASNTQNQMINSGLQATTILPSLMSGLQRDKSADMALLDDQLIRERLGLLSEYTAGEAQAKQAESAARNSFLSRYPSGSSTSTRYNTSGSSNRRYTSSGGISGRSSGREYSYVGSSSAYRSRYGRG